MNNRGQVVAIISFAVVIITLILLAPILMKIVITPTDKMISSFGNIDESNKSVEAMSYTRNVFTGAFDWVIFAIFVVNIVILLVTAFLVDVHPAFLVIYIIALVFLFMFAPSIMTAADRLWNNNPSLTTADNGVDMTTYMPITRFIFENFGLVILVVAALSGLIMFGKYKFSSNSSGGYSNGY